MDQIYALRGQILSGSSKLASMDARNATSTFFSRMKVDSERLWQNATLRSDIYGFQTQSGTKWLPGLKEVEIDAFEKDLGFRFPRIYRDFLARMNGTDKQTINIFGESGNAYTYSVGYYSYPRDLVRVKELIAWVYDAFRVAEEDVRVQAIPHILPVVSHRFLIVDNCPSNPILSMHGDDVIVYARDLPTFLVNDILRDHAIDEDIPATLEVPFWLRY
jgi:hypothetical protein